jgi:hypothetical protein
MLCVGVACGNFILMRLWCVCEQGVVRVAKPGQTSWVTRGMQRWARRGAWPAVALTRTSLRQLRTSTLMSPSLQTSDGANDSLCCSEVMYME